MNATEAAKTLPPLTDEQVERIAALLSLVKTGAER